VHIPKTKRIGLMNSEIQAQQEQRKQGIAGLFGRAAATYDTIGPRFFSHLGKRLVDLTRISPGSRVLDVAAGRGAILFPAAEVVGQQGRVTGIDLSEGMVNEMAEDIRRRGLQNIEVRQMDAESLSFPDASFDYVLCGFALFFFPNLERTMAEFRRVLAPGGRFAVTTWGKDDERWSWLGGLNQKYAPPPFKAMREAAAKQPPSPYPLNKVEGLLALMTDTGFVGAQVVEEGPEFRYANADEWIEVQKTQGNRIYFEMLPSDEWEQYTAEARQHLDAMQEPDGIPHALYTLFTRADKPAG
jgi:O-methyltransferase / aklanonic acid methyltransferase